MLKPVNDDRDYAPFVRQFEQTGFARVPLTDALARKVDRIYRLGEEFFVRSEAEKQSYSMQSFVEGYRELGPEYSQVPERPDLSWPRFISCIARSTFWDAFFPYRRPLLFLRVAVAMPTSRDDARRGAR